MKKGFFLTFVFSSLFLVVGFTSCSKCYECVETVEILDSNGNVIDTTETRESICTADNDEIARREANGAVCAN